MIKNMDKLYLYICEALKKLYEDDIYLINHAAIKESGEHVSERSIVFRFGIYLQDKLSKDVYLKYYNLDCEYNRNQDDIKKRPNGDKMIPDMILHKRGNNSFNLMTIEFKGYWNSNHSHDSEKLKESTNPKGELHYSLGYSIIFGKTLQETYIKSFVDGDVRETMPNPSVFLKRDGESCYCYDLQRGVQSRKA